jgi:hypothetical protein
MPPGRVAQLRQETVEMFYHGFDNYMKIAFPEDEVCFASNLYVALRFRLDSLEFKRLFLCNHSCALSLARP